MNLAELVVSHDAGSNALHDGSKWISWGELRCRAAALAGELKSRQVQPGDRVALALPTSVDFVVGYLGVLAAGAVAVPLNPQSPTAELETELASTTPVAALAAGAALGSLERTTACPLIDHFPPPAEDVSLSVVGRQGDDLAVLLFTSGTAGSPKAAMLSHGNLQANLHQMLALPGGISTSDDVGFGAVPLFHIFGLNVTLGLTLATGASLVLEERFDPAESLSMVVELGVTSILGAPPMFAAWAQNSPAGASQMRGVRRAISGAAALPPEVSASFEERFGIPLWQGYGLTEASPAVSTSLGTLRNRPGSVGRPLPGVEVRLVDESGSDALQGDPGEIWVRGDNVFVGYWGDPLSTEAVLGEDGWLKTGDIAAIDDEGDIHIVDRSKDLVIVSGFNVFPAEVEKVVCSIDGVDEAVVVGRPDSRTGESVEVVVVARGVTEEQIRLHCAGALARYKCPTTVRFVDELPRGLVGKALRRVLKEQQPA